MKTVNLDEKLFPIVNPVAQGFGFSVVALAASHVLKSFQVDVVIHKKGGVSVDDCSALYKALYPRLEIAAEAKNLNLTVSSPGIDRVFKSFYEFDVFNGEAVMVYCLDSNEWVHGTIVSTDNLSVTLKTKGEKINIAFDNIKKAKLEYSGGSIK